MQKRRSKERQVLAEKVTVRLDAEQLSALDKVADEEAVSVSFLVRHLVRRFLEQRRYTSGSAFSALNRSHLVLVLRLACT